MTDIIINPPQQYLYSKMTRFHCRFVLTDKTKSMGVFQTHFDTFAITIYNIFLRDLFINFDDIIINPRQQYLYSKMSGFRPDSSCTVKTKFMNKIYACKHIGYHYLQHFLKRPFYKFEPI